MKKITIKEIRKMISDSIAKSLEKLQLTAKSKKMEKVLEKASKKIAKRIKADLKRSQATKARPNRKAISKNKNDVIQKDLISENN